MMVIKMLKSGHMNACLIYLFVVYLMTPSVAQTI
jgi:hypothetical protein